MATGRIVGGIALALGLAAAAHGEQFSAGKVRTVLLSEPRLVSLGLDDALRVKLPEDMTYVCGIELNMKIPEEIAARPGTVSYSLYEDVVDDGPRSFSGTRSFSATIPPRLSLNVYIPLTPEFPIKDSPYSERVPVMPRLGDGTVFVRFQDVSGGRAAAAGLSVEVKPVLSGKGSLHLVVEPADEKELPSLRRSARRRGDGTFSVFIDDEPVGDARDILLGAGEHHASIVSDSYRNELRTFFVEPAKTTNLSVELRSIEPTLIFICPATTEIFFDGVRIENPRTAFLIDAGDHSARLVVGDYEVVRNFTAAYGKSYTLSLDIDANVREER